MLAAAQATFAGIGCSPTLVDSLACFGIDRPMEVQELAWQLLRDTDQDTAIIAEAGSGKTLAYLLPLVDKLLIEHVRAR